MLAVSRPTQVPSNVNGGVLPSTPLRHFLLLFLRGHVVCVVLFLIFVLLSHPIHRSFLYRRRCRTIGRQVVEHVRTATEATTETRHYRRSRIFIGSLPTPDRAGRRHHQPQLAGKTDADSQYSPHFCSGRSRRYALLVFFLNRDRCFFRTRAGIDCIVSVFFSSL